MRIIDVNYHVLDFGRRSMRLRNSTLDFTTQAAYVIEIQTSEGITGYALTANRGAYGGRELVEGPIRDALLGQDPRNIKQLWNRVVSGWRKPVSAGSIVTAAAGVDIALWDILGKVADLPLVTLLGGSRDRVPVYAAGGYYAEGKGVDDLAAEMLRYLDLGYTSVKMKVGGASMAEDVERVGAVRAAVGPAIQLKIDANYAWSSAEAVRFAHRVAEFDVFWIEEPAHPSDHRGHRRIRDAVPMAVASGENLYGLFESRPFLEHNAVDYLQVDANLAGGVTEWLRVAAAADAAHCVMAPHGEPLIHQHLVGAHPGSHAVEMYPELQAFLQQIAPVPQIVDGFLQIADVPGIGWEPEPGLLTRFAR